VKPIKILMLEDSDMDVEIVREELKQSKFANELIIYDTLEAATARLSRGDIDLLLVDIHLGLDSGLDFVRAVKDGGLIENTAVVIVSGSDSHKDISHATELNIDAWIEKPLDVDKFRFVVEKVPELNWLIVRKENAA